MRLRRLALVVAAAAAILTPATAPIRASVLFTDAMPPEEFAAHRAALAERLGEDVAILQGATERPDYLAFRQSNNFYYLSGVESPRAVLVIDGSSKKTTLFLEPRNERTERSEGPVLSAGEEAARLTGIADVRPRDQFTAFVAALGRRTVYTPFRMESLGAYTPDRVGAFSRASAADPWDGRASRETVFRDKLKAKAPEVEIKDLDPLLDDVRMIKTPREIAAIRRSTAVAGEAIIETMRSAHVGMREYELEAIGDYFFKRAGSQGVAYFGLVAAGKNSFYPHYHSGRSALKDGDLVLYDYAPDLQYYASDVTREFPANGRFTADQRELYGIYVKLYQALMASVRPGRPAELMRDAARRMDAVLMSTTFRNPKYREAAERFVQPYRNAQGSSLGHMIGLEVHDVSVRYDTLKPGMIFSIEPALTVPDERIYIRLEDPLLVTERGYENLSAAVPMEMDAIEKLMAEIGMFEKAAPATAGSRR
jgi:Xaa-Pro aminopeptidase